MMMDEYKKLGSPVGLNLYDYKVMIPEKMGIYDNYCVKRELLTITTTLVQ